MNTPHDDCVPLEPNWTNLGKRIQEGDHSAEEELCSAIERGLRLLIGRQLGSAPDVEDLVQEVLLTTIKQLRQGKVNDYSCLPAYIRIITQRKIIGVINKRACSRREVPLDDHTFRDPAETPERRICEDERTAYMRQALAKMQDRDREILKRFYLDEESPEQIQESMGLTETQYRLAKSRAKAQLGERVKKEILVAGFRRRFVRYATTGASGGMVPVSAGRCAQRSCFDAL